MITGYRFGKIVIDGKPFTHDLILIGNEIKPDWWRTESHRLDIEDIRSVIEEAHPTILVLGTGKFGMMKVPEETKNWLTAQGVQLIVETTGKAVKIYNRLSETQNIVGAFHISC
ncbi:MAG TPA: hypothetical protein ENG82_01735 [Bacteroidetes bacterium]|nr:hypothetical protein [Bacteroidota bacterium]HDL78572.1 hypothetical protein [Bacteroidota bacterium]